MMFDGTASQAKDTTSNHARVAPDLADLVALARRAAALPDWTRTAHARRAGAYRATMKGRGMEYAESRPYQAGDDVRALDWRLTARSGKPHTKLFREERERPVYVVVDLRAPMRFATHGAFKSVQAARAAALVAWKAVQTGDRIGGLVFNDALHHELQPARGKIAAVRLFKQMTALGRAVQAQGGAGTPKVEPLRRLRRLVKPGSLVFVMSDARGWQDAAAADLALLARHNEVFMLFVHDAFEARLPEATGMLRLAGGAREATIPLGDRALASEYAGRFTTRREQLWALCREHRVRVAALATTDDPLAALQRVLGARA